MFFSPFKFFTIYVIIITMFIQTFKGVNKEFFLTLFFMPFLPITGSPLSSLISHTFPHITRAFFHCPIVSDGKTIKSSAEHLNVITYSVRSDRPIFYTFQCYVILWKKLSLFVGTPLLIYTSFENAMNTSSLALLWRLLPLFSHWPVCPFKVCAQLVTTGQTFASIRVVYDFHTILNIPKKFTFFTQNINEWKSFLIPVLSDYCVTNGLTLDHNETNGQHIRHLSVVYMEYNSIVRERKCFVE